MPPTWGTRAASSRLGAAWRSLAAWPGLRRRAPRGHLGRGDGQEPRARAGPRGPPAPGPWRGFAHAWSRCWWREAAQLPAAALAQLGAFLTPERKPGVPGAGRGAPGSALARGFLQAAAGEPRALRARAGTAGRSFGRELVIKVSEKTTSDELMDRSARDPAAQRAPPLGRATRGPGQLCRAGTGCGHEQRQRPASLGWQEPAHRLFP